MRSITFLLLLTTSVAFAQSVPPLINYQGRIVDAAGEGIYGTKALAFSLFDDESGGSAVWGPQVFPAIPVIDGHYNVILGPYDVHTNNILQAFYRTNRWLEVTVDGVTNAPRQQIMTAPFAARADKAGNGVPPGTVAPFAGPTNRIPEGWLLCHGQLVSSTTYSDLFAAIGYAWGGSGSSFNLPDLRGVFLRGREESRTLGSYEDDAFQGHTFGGSGGDILSYSAAHKDVGAPNGYVYIAGGGFSPPGSNNNATWQDRDAQIVTYGVYGTPRVTSETRPKNRAVNYIIKY